MHKKGLKKKVTVDQNYEKYWSLTVEYSDIVGSQFINVLKIIIKFIDDKRILTPDLYTKDMYKELQSQVEKVYPKKNSASTRKSINQFVKLGFIKPFLAGYHVRGKEFLTATDETRKSIFAELFYKESSFNSAVTVDDSQNKQMNFLLKSITKRNSKTITDDELAGFVLVDNITKYSRGYLTDQEIISQSRLADVLKFKKRKYNQITYIKNFLKYVPCLYVAKTHIQFINDPSITFLENDISRDLYLFEIQKRELRNESVRVYGDAVCYIDKKKYKGLVASHIIPLRDCLEKGDEVSAYDYQNTILLQQNLDQHFDKFDFSICEDGQIFYNKDIKDNYTAVRKILSDNKLDDEILTSKRKEYLVAHNKIYKSKNL
jgi:hypothetical protein